MVLTDCHSILLMIVGIQFFSLGLLGEMISHMKANFEHRINSSREKQDERE